MYCTAAYTTKMSDVGIQYIAASLARRIATLSGGGGSGGASVAMTPAPPRPPPPPPGLGIEFMHERVCTSARAGSWKR